MAKVGDDAAQISSITEDSTEANLCSKFYEPALRETLRMHTWNCAKTRAKLAELTDEPVFGWENKFALPGDCVRPLRLVEDSSNQRVYTFNTEWIVEGRTILTNAGEVWLLYIKYLDDPNDMDPLFLRAFYMSLASKLAYPLTEDNQLVSNLEGELLNVILPEARRVNSFEGYEAPGVDSEWLEATLRSGSSISQSLPKFSQSSYGTLP